MTTTIETLQANLKSQCNRFANGLCSNTSCLKRGGYKTPPVDYNVATCESYEQLKALETLQAQIEQLTKRAEAAEASCAVMWEALDALANHPITHAVGCSHKTETCSCHRNLMAHALTANPGATLLAQLKSLTERNKELVSALQCDALWCLTGKEAPISIRAEFKQSGALTSGPNNCAEAYRLITKALNLSTEGSGE